MKTILTVIRKELVSTLRDRRTLISAILIPALAMPLLILGITKLQIAMNEKEDAKALKVALFNAPSALESAFAASKITVVKSASLSAAKDSVKAEDFDAALDFSPRFTADVDNLHTGAVQFYYKSTNGAVEERVTKVLDDYKAGVVSSRFQRMNLDSTLLNPVAVTPVDVASTQEQIGTAIGGFIPYIFILFCFIGCLYPTLDIITGEKEKGTIETLLTAPASRMHILLGKMLAIALIGTCAALMTIAGMYATLRIAADIPAEILTTVTGILNAKFIIMLFAMLIPLSLFFAGLLSSIAVRAASFKEAQSYVTPLMFVVIVPAMIALMPGVKLTWGTALIPILNIALATKEIIGGTINGGMYAVTVLSLVAFAAAALLVSSRAFGREGNILK